MATRTYAVGTASTVRRRDNNTGAWIDVSIPTVNGLSMRCNDVMTDPNNSDIVIVVGQNLGSLSPYTGVLYSDDAGATWVRPAGTWNDTEPKEFYEVWWVDSNIVWIVGQNGVVLLSTDGGLTFNEVPTRPSSGNYAFTTCIHALDAQTAVVAGDTSLTLFANSPLVYKTTDGGNTWTILNGGNILVNSSGSSTTTGYPNGIWISPDQQRIVLGTSNCQFLSTDSGATILDTVSGTSVNPRNGYHLTWYPSYAALPDNFRHAGGASTVFNESTDLGLNWSTTQIGTSSLRLFGAHFYTENDGYYVGDDGQTYESSDGGVTGIVSDSPGVGAMIAVWTGVIPRPPKNPPCGECPEGFTYNAITNDCEQIESISPNCGPTIYTAEPGNTRKEYGNQGAFFFEDATGREPLSEVGFAGINDSLGNPLAIVNNVSNSLWGDGTASPLNGRLNLAGVWAAPPSPVPTGWSVGDPTGEWIGFTACVDVLEDGVYCIGIAADNAVRFRIDGVQIFEATTGATSTFVRWYVIPYTLTAGQHNIELEGLNNGSNAAFAAEIYATDTATLATFTTQLELDAVTIFSTEDTVGLTFDLGVNSGCQCPDGYVLSVCEGELTCVRVEKSDFVPCPCYLATNCDDSNDQILIALSEGDEPLDVNLTYIFDIDPNKCWTIEESTDCNDSVISLNTGTIDSSGTVGVEDDLDFLWEVTGIPPSGSAPSAPFAAAVSDQTWLPGYSSLPDAAWITQTPTPHDQSAGEVRYSTSFNIPLGFVPSLALSILSDDTAQIYLNGNLIGDTAIVVNPETNPLTFTETTIGFFNIGAANTLEVRVQNATQGSNGFAMTALLVSNEPLGETVVVVQTFEDCEACEGTCYKLTDCLTGDVTISDDELLEEYVGSIIEVVVDPNTTLCLLVEKIDCINQTISPLPGTIVECHTTCEKCLPPPPAPTPELEIRNRTVKPGYQTKGCPPEYVDKVSCKFAEAMYQEAVSIRYGIEFCCEHAINQSKWAIKKEILDLKMILDPEACCVPTEECCVPDNVEAVLRVQGEPPNCKSFFVDTAQDVGTGEYFDCCNNPVSITMTSLDPPMSVCVNINAPYTNNGLRFTKNPIPCDC